MTIEIKVTNPAEHQPEELRVVASVLNSFAADLESGKIQHRPAFAAVGDRLIGTHEVPAQVGQIAPLTSTATAASTASVASESGKDAAASGASNTSNAGELDSAGVRWDERIHSETKSKNKDLTWRIKRNTEQSLIDTVLAEQAAANAGADDDAPELPETDDDAPELPADGDDSAPDVPAEDPPVAAATDVQPVQVLQFITANKIDPATANATVAGLGIAGLNKTADLFGLHAKDPSITAQVFEVIKALAG